MNPACALTTIPETWALCGETTAMEAGIADQAWSQRKIQTETLPICELGWQITNY